MKLSRVDISDHALVRYLERVHDIDTETIREKLAAHIRPAMDSGASIWFDGCFTYIFGPNRALVTMYEGAPRMDRKRHRGDQTSTL